MPLAPYRTGDHFRQFLVLFFVVWSLRATVGSYVDEQLPPGGAQETYALFSKLLLWITPAVLYALAIRSDRPRQSMRLNLPTLTTRWWVPWTVGIAALAIVFWSVASQHDLGSGQLAARTIDRSGALALWVLPTVAVEEAFFRGLVLTELSERLRFWFANAFTALLFVAIHWPHWLWTQDFGLDFVTQSAGLFGVGLVTGVLTHQTRSIWPSAAWRTVNQLIVGAA